MAEVEYGGVKVSGKGFLGKLIWILPLMGTLAGGSWAVFEFYKDLIVKRFWSNCHIQSGDPQMAQVAIK